MAKTRFGVRGTCATLCIGRGLLTGFAQVPIGPLATGIIAGSPEQLSGPAGARPPQAVTPVKGRSIIVKPGQSLGGIAERHQVSTRAIIAANHLTPPYDLKIGARLVIPDAPARSIPVKATAPRHLDPPLGVEAGASRPRSRPKRPAPEVIPLDDPSPALPGPR